jgi:hypothetical protein
VSRRFTIRLRKVRDDGYGLNIGTGTTPEFVLSVEDLRELQVQISVALHFEPKPVEAGPSTMAELIARGNVQP